MFNQMSGTMIFNFIYEYSVFQIAVLKNMCKITNPFLLILATPIFSIIDYTLLLTFAVYRSFIQAILWISLRRNFKGLITGCDLGQFAIVKDFDRVHMHIVITLRNNCELFLKQVIKEKLLKTDALLIEVHYFMGYYYKKAIDNVSCDEVFEAIISQDDWINTVMFAMPRNGKLPWKIFHITTLQQIKVVFKIHHCLMDWLSFYGWFTSNFCEQEDLFGNQLSAKLKEKTRYKTSDGLRYVPEGVCSDYLSNIVNPSGDIYATYSEATSRLFYKIKPLKEQGYTMTAVLLTALSAAVNEYFSESNQDSPNFVDIPMPMQINTDRFNHFFNTKTLRNELGNDYTCICYKIPINTKVSLIERLKLISCEIARNSNYFDFKFCYLLMTVHLKVYPSFLYNWYKRYISLPVGLTSLPAGPLLKFANSQVIENMQVYMPRLTTGLQLIFCLYDDRLHFSASSDKSRFKSKEELDKIIKKVILNMDNLGNQAGFLCHNK